MNKPLEKKKGLLNIYCTAGYPELDSTLEVMKALEESGVDMIELGMPYSDPLADGPVIQHSGSVALANGMTIHKLFEQLDGFRTAISIPVILMGYMNPIIQYGFEKFCADCARVGIDGLILPDLPMHEFETEYKNIIRKHRLDFVFLVTPETSDQRVLLLDKLSTGFLYAVSSSSTTGTFKQGHNIKSYLERLERLGLQHQVLVGFGIKDRNSFEEACSHAKGAVIGTAFIKALEGSKDIKAATRAFVSSIIS